MYTKYIAASLTAFFLLFSSLSCSQDNKGSTPKSTSESTPSQPTNGDSGPSTPIPGWKKFAIEKAELWLPESYEGGNIKKDVDLIIARAKQMGSDFDKMVQIIEQSRDLLLLLAFDSNIGPLGEVTNVNITAEPVLSTVSIDDFIDLTIKQLPSQFKVIDREIVSLDRYQAGNLTWKATLNGIETRILQYIIKDRNSTVWVVTYTTSADEFDQRLPSFKKSINTFYLLP
ncbi:hypothetical protein [Acaryochloris sp. IP29b_bin.137]|uniref:hypothetical protein n=1 Tax=Acaryochloris sp. IP29b_bin.137 TaxID=2969217 RepID=UPI002604EC04|nr:hypothetical protein [Acaryochloris sp. IP29b_bin.137]